MEQVPVTVLVPSYRRKDRLERALGSVFGQRGVRPLEVIVVDDGSKDGTAERAWRRPATTACGRRRAPSG